VLRENVEWTNLDGLSGRWKFINGVSTYERNAHSEVKRTIYIEHGEATGKCLK
jgi:hypothetical protein